MQNDEATPVNHSLLSGFGATASSAVGHGLKSGVKSAVYWIAGVAAVAATIGVIIGSGGIASALLWGIGMGTVGVVAGAYTSPFAGVLGGMFGFGKGAVEGSHRVNQERGAAEAMNAQLSAYQSMALGQGTNIYAPTANAEAKYNFPVQGSAMNPAMSRISAESAQSHGQLDGLNLQRA
jgi:hypothetical protein